MNPNYKSLYLQYVQTAKPSGINGNQYIGKCPFHNDKKPSFSFNVDSGLCNCFAGCFDGNAYQFADKIGHPNPKQFINGESAEYKAIDGDTSAPDLEKMIHPLVENLLGTPDMILECWDEKHIKQLGVGYKDDEYYFSHHDIHGNIIAIHKHKSTIIGSGRSKWYLAHLIHTYETNKPLYICEGEKDAISMLSIKLQCISNTTGCASIPKASDGYYDFNPISSFQEVIIVYDNDDAGRKGAERLGRELIKEYPDKTIKIAKWDNDLPDTFDATDSLLDPDDNGNTLFKAFDNAIQIKPERSGFNFLNGLEFLNTEFTPVEPIVKYLVYSNNITILAGQTGAGKSTAVLQMALCIASGLPVFGYFEVTQKRVMLVRFEGEDDDFAKMFKKMTAYFISKSGTDEWLRSNLIIKTMEATDEEFIDNWQNIELSLQETGFSDGVLIVDNMYTSTDVELQSNEAVKDLLRVISNIRKRYNLAPILVSHPTKGVQADKDLHPDQIQGGKVITNFVSSIVQMDTSSISNDLRIMKITKGGRSEANELLNIPFKLHADVENHIFHKGSIINNIAVHFSPVKDRWEIKLLQELAEVDELQHLPHFTREQLRNNIPDSYMETHFSGSNPETAISRYINKLCDWGFVIKTMHNQYQLVWDEVNELASI